MLTVYVPVAGTRTINLVTTNGTDGVSTDILLLNILIELRALHGALGDGQRGLVTETAAQYRNDVVNSTVNPVI